MDKLSLFYIDTAPQLPPAPMKRPVAAATAATAATTATPKTNTFEMKGNGLKKQK